MGGFSNDDEQLVLDAAMGGTAYGGVTPLKLALTTVAVTDTDDATTITKCNYTGYADINVASSDWNAATTSGKTNLNPLAFGADTAGTNSAIGFAIYNPTGNKIRMYGTVTTLSIAPGVTPSFGAGALALTLD